MVVSDVLEDLRFLVPTLSHPLPVMGLGHPTPHNELHLVRHYPTPHTALLPGLALLGAAERISDHVHNVKSWFNSKGNGTQDILAWLVRQDEYARVMAFDSPFQTSEGDGEAEGSPARRFWYAVSLVLGQVEGILQVGQCCLYVLLINVMSSVLCLAHSCMCALPIHACVLGHSWAITY